MTVSAKTLLAACKRIEKRWDKLRAVDPLASDLDLTNIHYIRDALTAAPRTSLASILAENDDDMAYAAAHLLAESARGGRKAITNKKTLDVPLAKVRCIVGDLSVKGDVCNGGRLIVTGNVEIGGTYWDRDVGDMLTVLGNVRIARTNIYGGTRVRGNLTVTQALFGIDHSSSIFVGKTLRTPLAILADKSIYAGAVAIRLLVGEVSRVEAKPKKIKNASLSQARLRKLLVSEVIGEDPEIMEVPILLEQVFKRAERGQRLFR